MNRLEGATVVGTSELSILAAMHDKLLFLSDRLSNMNDNTDSFQARLVGSPPPTPVKSGTDARPARSGIIGLMQDRLDQIQDYTETLELKLSHLNRLA